VNAATVLSALQTLEGSLFWLDSSTVWVFDVLFASNPPLPPAATGGRVRELAAMMTVSILRPALQGSVIFATLSCYRINANE